MNWQKEKTKLYEVLFQRIVKGQQRIHFRDLIKNELPEFCESAIKHRARQIFSEHNVLKMQSSDRFDLDAPAVRKAFQCLADTVMDCLIFSDHELSEIVGSAIALQYDAIVRPKTKLLELLFHKNDICSKKDAVVVLSGFGNNRPFVNSLITEIEYWPTPRLKKDDLENLALEVEKSVHREAPIASITQDLDALLAFESSIYASKRLHIPSEVIIAMLKERSLQFYCTCFQDETSPQTWTSSEAANALERFMLVGAVGHASEEHNFKNNESGNDIRATLLEIEQNHCGMTSKMPASTTGQPMHIAAAVHTGLPTKPSQLTN